MGESRDREILGGIRFVNIVIDQRYKNVGEELPGGDGERLRRERDIGIAGQLPRHFKVDTIGQG